MSNGNTKERVGIVGVGRIGLAMPGLSLPITRAIKELLKDARRIKATNAPKWTGTSNQ
jgi:hypothetical protein